MSEKSAVETQQEAATPEQPGHETFSTKASKEEGARELSMTWNIGANIQESIDIFGAEVVHGTFKKGIIVAVQAPIRRMLEAKNEDGSQKYTDEQIVSFVQTQYKPGVRAAREAGTGTKAMEKAIALLLKMSTEEREKFFADQASKATA